MLHNSGSYGPNEAPINMGAPLNVSQMSTPMNVVQNLNNLSKSPQPSPQAAAGHFGLPNYPSYVTAPPNIGPQMHSFPNYHGVSFQPSYVPQSSSVMPNLNWQNGMFPMNLNMHNEHAPNMSNYPNVDRRSSENSNNAKEPSYSSKVPLNVPQVPNNFFHRHFENESNSQSMFNNHYKPYDSTSNDLSAKPHEKLLNDNTRRKNLENTVRLIENILISTTKNREMQLENEPEQNVKSVETASINKDTDPEDSNTEIMPLELKIETAESSKESSKMFTDSNSQAETIVSECSNETAQTDDGKMVIEMSEEHVEHMNISIKLEPEDVSEVEVKIEPISSWTDSEHTAPFHRDVHGVLHEDIGCGNVIDAESSVEEATKIMDSHQDSGCYFECPYCSLLFKHPKRFLIHTKWHLFGLINERRIEIAKEKEMRKHQRRERQTGQGQPPARKPWPCKDCDKVFYARGGLESHRKRYHTNRIRECKMCAKTITGWSAWRAHLATHTTESGFQCTHCPKRFKYSHSLSKHKDTHLEKTHACSECPKKFGSQALLKVHMKSHERMQKGASFHCSFCGKAFFDKFNLQIHERTHTNERPFVCEICNATFGCNSNLSRHIKVSHNSAKPFECSTCHRSFAAESIRDRHEIRVHGDPKDFKYVCKQCPSRYLKQNELKKHTYKMHPKSKKQQAAEDSK